MGPNRNQYPVEEKSPENMSEAEFLAWTVADSIANTRAAQAFQREIEEANQLEAAMAASSATFNHTQAVRKHYENVSDRLFDQETEYLLKLTAEEEEKRQAEEKKRQEEIAAAEKLRDLQKQSELAKQQAESKDAAEAFRLRRSTAIANAEKIRELPTKIETSAHPKQESENKKTPPASILRMRQAIVDYLKPVPSDEKDPFIIAHDLQANKLIGNMNIFNNRSFLRGIDQDDRIDLLPIDPLKKNL